MNPLDRITGLPGEAMVRKGLADFSKGHSTLESFLVQIGSPRLREAGLPIQGAVDPDADRKLYALLCATHGEEAHSQYNAWIRQLVSFERALERAVNAGNAGRQ